MEVDQHQRTKQSHTTLTIWRRFSELFTLDSLSAFCNPMLDTLDPKILDLTESLPDEHLHDDKCLEMVTLSVEKEKKDVSRKMNR